MFQDLTQTKRRKIEMNYAQHLPEAPTLAEFLENPTKYRPKEEYLCTTLIEDETVLTHCIKIQLVPAVIALLKAGADPNLPSRRGVTPISAAAHKGNTAIMQALLEAGAAVNAINSSGSTALIQAAHFGHLDAVKLLIQNNAATDFANVKGTTALMRSSQEGHVEISKCLIEAEVDVNKKNHEGMNALMLASQRGHADIVLLLIRAGAAMDEQTSQGSTALMLACKRGHEKCAEVLVSMGAEIYMKDRRGRTAKDTATRRNHFGLLIWLDTQVQVRKVQESRYRLRYMQLMEMREAYITGHLRLKPMEHGVDLLCNSIKRIVQYEEETAASTTTTTNNNNINGDNNSNNNNNNNVIVSKYDSKIIADDKRLLHDFLTSSPSSILPFVAKSPEETYQEMKELYTKEGLTYKSLYNHNILYPIPAFNTKIAPKHHGYADWQWPSLLYKCLNVPHGVFEIILEYIPLPRVWQWSLLRIKRRTKLSPVQSMIDMCNLMDEILCDHIIVGGGEQRQLLVKINRSPQIQIYLIEKVKMPISLLQTLCEWSDVQSLLFRDGITSTDIVFKTSTARQMLEATIQLYQWARKRVNAVKTLNLFSTAVSTASPGMGYGGFINNNSSNPNNTSMNSMHGMYEEALQDFDDGIDMMEATDAGGEENSDNDDNDDINDIGNNGNGSGGSNNNNNTNNGDDDNDDVNNMEGGDYVDDILLNDDSDNDDIVDQTEIIKHMAFGNHNTSTSTNNNNNNNNSSNSNSSNMQKKK